MNGAVPARRAGTSVLVAAALLAAAACGGSGGGGGGAGGGDGAPRRGGAMTYALEAETTLGFCIPEAQFAISGIQVVHTIYDTLTVPGPHGEAVPWLAKSVAHNKRFDRWTIVLRSGVEFHDGSKLTAEVVKNNIDAWRGAYEKRTPLLYLFVLEPIRSVKVTGPLTVEVRLKQPWPAFAGYLHGNGRLGIMAQKQLDDPKRCDRDLIGTGPFRLREWKLNDHLTAVRNPDWWYAKLTGKPYPYLDSITYRPIISASDRLRAVRTGAADAGHFSNQRTIVSLRSLAKQGDFSFDESMAFPEVGYVMLNASRPPFDDVRARRALAYALDRVGQDRLTGGGIGTPASGPFGPGVMGYLEDTGYPEYDLAEAKRLVAAYERDTGRPLQFALTSPADADNIETAQAVVESWRKAGIEARILSVADQSQYINYAVGGEYDAILWRNHPGGDPDGQYVWWHSASGNPVNFGRFNDPVIDRALDAGRVETDPERRRALYEDLNREFARQVWNVWGNWSIWGVAYRGGLHAEAGAYGPPPPGARSSFRGLAVGHPVFQFWRG
jgi:peptide/nickel transport system substrate-binding protein